MRDPQKTQTGLTHVQWHMAQFKWTDRSAKVALGQLREFYRSNFKAGESDESFYIWIDELGKEIGINCLGVSD